MKDTDRDATREQADQTGEQDKPPIVLDGKASENPKHPSRSIVDIADSVRANPAFALILCNA
ncbi:hypothetical protein [Bradyrhizobium sp. 173]|uniref:hypothetical protein n=1 Tax=Bradyrhizobium sp. 173 TaxID=2782644 RepID=UPI001FFB1E82|nr:hypothetical protein [Bradyrhizobium sp. 173]